MNNNIIKTRSAIFCFFDFNMSHPGDKPFRWQQKLQR
ncbi:hypothetical protein Cf24236_3599 [Citrobacter farmeri]|nr:hypothetical protein Cf24236_3599 [Citrobacter farmeri]